MEDKDSKKALWATYLRVIRFGLKFKGLFVLSLFLTLLGVCFQLLTPFILGNFFTYAQKQLTSGGAVDFTLILLTTGFIGLQITQAIVHGFNDYFLGKWWMYTDDNIFNRIYKHVIFLSADFFEKNPTGKIQERIWQGPQAITNILENSFINILPQLIYTVIATGILFFIKPVFGFLVFLVVPIYFMLSRFFFKKLKSISEKGRKIWEDIQTYLTESIFNSKTVKTFSTEEYHYKKVSKEHLLGVENEIEWQLTSAKLRTLRHILINLLKGISLGLAFFYVLKGEIALGYLIVIWTYVSESLEPVNRMARNIDTIQKDLVSVARTFEYLDTRPTIADSEKAKELKIIDGSIEFKNLSFTYGEKQVISNLNLQIPAGKTVAIVGKSGSGKSTLVKLLLRFYDPQRGEIKIDGQNIKNVKQESLRKSIATVMQDSVLFNDTIEKNISYSDPKTNFERVVRAAKTSSAEIFINSLPNGYKTLVGERGVKLSGGEQQRVGIARAVLKDSPIIVFDEATSSLDSENENIIQDAMWKIIKNKTTIIIAHRLSTVMKADMIVVMDKGRIVETGNHQDLVEQKGIYSKLFEIQSGGYLDTIDAELVGAK